MRKLMLLPCAALITAAAPASSAPPAVSSQVAPSDAQQAIGAPGGGGTVQRVEEKKICKQLDSTGSRLPRRACLTEKEWKQLQAELDQ